LLYLLDVWLYPPTAATTFVPSVEQARLIQVVLGALVGAQVAPEFVEE